MLTFWLLNEAWYGKKSGVVRKKFTNFDGSIAVTSIAVTIQNVVTF